MKKNLPITVMVQSLYGNRTMTQTDAERFDAVMLGYLNSSRWNESKETERIDRTIIRVPNTDNLVIVYNKYQEAEALESLRDFIQSLKDSESRFNPTAVIPELGIVLYSRCIVCRMNEAGDLESLENGDSEKFIKYLAQ